MFVTLIKRCPSTFPYRFWYVEALKTNKPVFRKQENVIKLDPDINLILNMNKCGMDNEI